MGLRSSNSAVNEILSTILILAIAIGFFGSTSFFVVNSVYSSYDDAQPHVTIVGFIVNNTIYLEHRGGQGLNVDQIEVVFTADADIVKGKIKDYMGGTPPELWTLGQEVFHSFDNLDSKRVEALVVDTISGAVLFDGVIRTGFEGAEPQIETLPATNVTGTSVQLHMNYTLYSSAIYNYVWFQYRKQGDIDWINTTSTFVSFATSDIYSITVENLEISSNTYDYRACISFYHFESADQTRYGDIHTFG
ncbi:MAG: hypothetical protein R6V50_00925 [Thermoplasmatota archaeon]